jgi:hypothetical protein
MGLLATGLMLCWSKAATTSFCFTFAAYCHFHRSTSPTDKHDRLPGLLQSRDLPPGPLSFFLLSILHCVIRMGATLFSKQKRDDRQKWSNKCDHHYLCHTTKVCHSSLSENIHQLAPDEYPSRSSRLLRDARLVHQVSGQCGRIPLSPRLLGGFFPSASVRKIWC